MTRTTKQRLQMVAFAPLGIAIFIVVEVVWLVCKGLDHLFPQPWMREEREKAKRANRS